MKKMYVEKFVPPLVSKNNKNLKSELYLFGKKWVYATSGKAALYHIIKSLDINGKILVPCYVCDSILEPIQMCGLELIFYDIDEEDLNFDIASIKSIIQNENISACLGVSLYGNPGNLAELEQLCSTNRILLIDDAAQSFGAQLAGRKVGTFGDAGFFSFSPGKPLAGHRGAYFWTKNSEYNFKRKTQYWIHKLAYIDFYFNRLNIYKYRNLFRGINFVKIIVDKFIKEYNGGLCRFEENILEGILSDNLDKNYEFRNRLYEMFRDNLVINKKFRLIYNERGKANRHKIVLKADCGQSARDLIIYLKANYIYSSNGYKLLYNNGQYINTGKKLDRTIVEIPLENDEEKLLYILKVINNHIKIYENK